METLAALDASDMAIAQRPEVHDLIRTAERDDAHHSSSQPPSLESNTRMDVGPVSTRRNGARGRREPGIGAVAEVEPACVQASR